MANAGVGIQVVLNNINQLLIFHSRWKAELRLNFVCMSQLS